MSVTRTTAFCVFLVVTIMLTPACALLKKPTPLTQLQLSLDSAALSWPARLELGNVKARGMLQTDRVIVTQGALVMQHAGLRWVAAPAALLAEQLAIARVASLSAPTSKHPGRAANIDVWLSDFNIAVNAKGDTSVAVSAWASVGCAKARSASQVPAMTVALPLNSTDPQRIAERFNTAATMVFKTLLAQGAEKSARC